MRSEASGHPDSIDSAGTAPKDAPCRFSCGCRTLPVHGERGVSGFDLARFLKHLLCLRCIPGPLFPFRQSHPGSCQVRSKPHACLTGWTGIRFVQNNSHSASIDMGHSELPTEQFGSIRKRGVCPLHIPEQLPSRSQIHPRFGRVRVNGDGPPGFLDCALAIPSHQSEMSQVGVQPSAPGS